MREPFLFHPLPTLGLRKDFLTQPPQNYFKFQKFLANPAKKTFQK
jgi:hypothetical protein